MPLIQQFGSGDNIAGDKVMGDKIAGNKVIGDNIDTQINNSQDLVQAARDVKTLLDQLSLNYPGESNRVLGAKALDRLESNPELRNRLMRGIKAGSFAALEKMVDHPVARFFIEGAKEVLKP
jgi:internalin A